MLYEAVPRRVVLKRIRAHFKRKGCTFRWPRKRAWYVVKDGEIVPEYRDAPEQTLEAVARRIDIKCLAPWERVG